MYDGIKKKKKKGDLVRAKACLHLLLPKLIWHQKHSQKFPHPIKIFPFL